MTVMISQALLNDMVVQAKAAAPAECCGLLIGDNDPPSRMKNQLDAYIEGLIMATNVSAQPHRRFEIDPATLIAGQRSHRRRLIGCYHSHPTGDAWPSAADIDGATVTDTIWLIIAGDTVRAYVTKPQQFAECGIIAT